MLISVFGTSKSFVVPERAGATPFPVSEQANWDNGMATANANAAPGATRPVDQHVEFVVKVIYVGVI